ncbi:MAG: hypothetical protein WAO98_00950 [Alphaproteobacteria bacterium]
MSSQSLRAADPLTTPLVPARDATPPLLPRIAHSSSYTTMRSEAARTDFTQPPQGLSIVGPNDSLFNQSGLFPTDPNIKGIGARFQEGNASIAVGVMNADKFRVPDRGRSGDKRVVFVQGRISFQGPK